MIKPDRASDDAALGRMRPLWRVHVIDAGAAAGPGAVESAQEVVAGTRWSSPCALPVAASIERGSMMLS